MKITLAAIVAAIMLMVTPTAGAHPTAAHSSGVSWQGQTWHIASGTFASGQRNCPNHVHFGTVLTIQVYAVCGGGVGSTLNRHHGTWSVTFKDTTGGGKYAIGLWPQNGSRPEIDFAEDRINDSQRLFTTATYHPLPGCTACIQVKLPGNFTTYHTASVVWSSAGFSLLMDGKPWAHFSSSYGGQEHLFIHNEAWGSSGTSTLSVSKVTVG